MHYTQHAMCVLQLSLPVVDLYLSVVMLLAGQPIVIKVRVVVVLGSSSGKISISELQCQFQGMLPVVYALRMKLIDTFGGTFPVTKKVIYAFLYVIDNCRYS